jgi:hypothetical protein
MILALRIGEGDPQSATNPLTMFGVFGFLVTLLRYDIQRSVTYFIIHASDNLESFLSRLYTLAQATANTFGDLIF